MQPGYPRYDREGTRPITSPSARVTHPDGAGVLMNNCCGQSGRG